MVVLKPALVISPLRADSARHTSWHTTPHPCTETPPRFRIAIAVHCMRICHCCTVRFGVLALYHTPIARCGIVAGRTVTAPVAEYRHDILMIFAVLARRRNLRVFPFFRISFSFLSRVSQFFIVLFVCFLFTSFLMRVTLLVLVIFVISIMLSLFLCNYAARIACSSVHPSFHLCSSSVVMSRSALAAPHAGRFTAR